MIDNSVFFEKHLEVPINDNSIESLHRSLCQLFENLNCFCEFEQFGDELMERLNSATKLDFSIDIGKVSGIVGFYLSLAGENSLAKETLNLAINEYPNHKFAYTLLGAIDGTPYYNKDEYTKRAFLITPSIANEFALISMSINNRGRADRMNRFEVFVDNNIFHDCARLEFTSELYKDKKYAKALKYSEISVKRRNEDEANFLHWKILNELNENDMALGFVKNNFTQLKSENRNYSLIVTKFKLADYWYSFLEGKIFLKKNYDYFISEIVHESADEIKREFQFKSDDYINSENKEGYFDLIQKAMINGIDSEELFNKFVNKFSIFADLMAINNDFDVNDSFSTLLTSLNVEYSINSSYYVISKKKWKMRLLLNLDKFHFGKYKGNSVNEVMHKDMAYIYWAAENVNNVCFDPNVLSNDQMIKVVDHSIKEIYNLVKYCLYIQFEE